MDIFGSFIALFGLIAIAIVLFLIFRSIVLWYWRINEAVDLLKGINEKLSLLVGIKPNANVNPNLPAENPCAEPPTADAQQMEKYGITFDGERYVYGEYKFSKLSDSISCAKIQKNRSV